MSVVSALDVFHDVTGRAYAAGWRFDPASPLEVQLQLSAGGDIALIASGERLVVALYPLTPWTRTLTGASGVALEFLVATEALVPRCAGCESPSCVSCVTTGAGLDAALTGLAHGRAPAPRWRVPRPERSASAVGCGCRVEGPAVALCERHFAELAGESR